MQPAADPPAAPTPTDAADVLASFDAVPLFMQSLPESLGGTVKPRELKPGETDPSNTLAALQALAYDGDPSEIAENFRTQGNDLFKRRKFRDAVGFYTRALDEVGKDLPIEERRTLWSNRAAANLELSNFGATLRDCSQVLGQTNASYPDPPSDASHRTTMKALLRSARALSALEKLPEALDALSRLALLEKELGEEEKDVGKKWREEVERKMAARERKEAEKAEKERRKREGDAALVLALTQRGVVFPRPTAKKALFADCPTDVTPPHFDPDIMPVSSLPTIPLLPPSPPSADYVPWQPAPPETPLVFPVFLLLPLASPPTRDLIMAFPEQATFGDALQSMEQDPSAVQLYLATARGRVLKIGAKLTLGKVLAAAGQARAGEPQDGWELKEGWALEMVGVPKGPKGEEWIQGWKAEVKAGTAAIL
ncbi:HSP70/90 co-chaperone [Rhodotorula kratochvilovae]